MDVLQLLKLIIYFVVGGLQDVLSTIDVKAVQNNKALRSASVTFINTLISYIIFYFIIASPQFLMEVFAYAMGGAICTYVVIKKKWY